MTNCLGVATSIEHASIRPMLPKVAYGLTHKLKRAIFMPSSAMLHGQHASVNGQRGRGSKPGQRCRGRSHSRLHLLGRFARRSNSADDTGHDQPRPLIGLAPTKITRHFDITPSPVYVTSQRLRAPSGRPALCEFAGLRDTHGVLGMCTAARCRICWKALGERRVACVPHLITA